MTSKAEIKKGKDWQISLKTNFSSNKKMTIKIKNLFNVSKKISNILNKNGH